VTGSNKGIGFAIVRGLCKQFSGDVILTGIYSVLYAYVIQLIQSSTCGLSLVNGDKLQSYVGCLGC